MLTKTPQRQPLPYEPDPQDVISIGADLKGHNTLLDIIN